MSLNTVEDLKKKQALPLDLKVRLTQNRIREWVNHWGKEGVYISFSGGKDSTVLLDIVRGLYPDISAVFCDTGLEYPEIKDFVKGVSNVDILHPKMDFRSVIRKWGYPLIGKEVAENLQGGRVYVKELLNNFIEDTETIYKNLPYYYNYERLKGTGKYKSSIFSQKRWGFLLYAPFNISNKCCEVMKKNPAGIYSRKHKKTPIIATMTEESRLRKGNWLQYGCNAYDFETPTSRPMSFWTQQDVLKYIHYKDIPISSVYGEIKCNKDTFTTTGCDRTGCVFCGFGLHMDTPSCKRMYEGIRLSNPDIIDFQLRGGEFDREDGMWKPDERGLGFWFVLEWCNVHGNMHYNFPNRKYYIETYGNFETEAHLIKENYL